MFWTGCCSNEAGSAWGRGIRKIVDGMTKAGLPQPKFEYDCGGIRVTFARDVALQSHSGESSGEILELMRLYPNPADMEISAWPVNDESGKIFRTTAATSLTSWKHVGEELFCC